MSIESFYKKLSFPYRYIDNSYVKLFLLNKEEIKFFSLKDNYMLLDEIEDISLKKYLLNELDVLVMPCKFIDGSIYSYVFRSLRGKSFFNYKGDKDIPMMYGLHDFVDFKYGGKVVMVEGIKDRQVVRLLYKYVISYLTSKISSTIFDYFSKISSKIIIIGDNDKAGLRLKEDETYSRCGLYYLHSKDCGDYIDKGDKDVFEMIKNILRNENVYE